MGLFHSLYGMIHIELISADIPGLLSKISENNISVASLRSVDEMTVCAKILRTDYKKVYTIIQRRGDKLTVLEKRGIYWKSKRLVLRPVLLTGISVLLLLSLIVPSRIFFVTVEGNSSVPSKLIIEAADKCGISFFASRRRVRSEKVKNALLEEVPELQWVGVNTAGCVATINVTEKTVSLQPEEAPNSISSIVASRDGVIWECSVLRGNQLCQVGQVVTEGQTLVSGYTDCGITIKATRAEAEIYARTLRDLEVVTPVITEKRISQGDKKTNYSLLFGKKLIKLFKGSGISDASCVKIYEQIKLTLPGGFQLPVSLIRETVEDCNFSAVTQTDDYEWLPDASISYLHTQMIAGQILGQDIQTELQNEICYLYGKFACLEMIGQEKEEVILQR